MAIQAGHLLFNRMRITIPAEAVDFPVNTLLQQTNLGLSPDPPLGGVDPFDAPPGIASRVMVIPMMPLVPWGTISHKEPILDPATNTVRVDFSNSDDDDVVINVLFWDPHTSVCPLNADTYRGACPLMEFIAINSSSSNFE